jgi:hypothetical protein
VPPKRLDYFLEKLASCFTGIGEIAREPGMVKPEGNIK